MLIIGDIHGTEYWKDILDNTISENKDGKVVFLGDYVDSFTISPEDCYKNLQNIIDFAYLYNPTNTILLLGNHDYHYLYPDSIKGSGYQKEYAEKYFEIYDKNKHLFRINYQFEKNKINYICTHAGITTTWLGKQKTNIFNLETLYLNNPDAYDFKFPKNITMTYSPSGDDEYQSPLWVRPSSLYQKKIQNYHQIIGHTQYPEITKLGQNITVVCTHNENNYILI
jgi:Predicted phosphohydrolases